MLILSMIANAWPCAMLLTKDQGALATSAAQQVILESNDAGTQTKYQIDYAGDAESFGWLVVVHGNVGEGDVTEADASQFDTYRELSQPRLVSHSIGGGGGSAGCPVGCGSMEKSIGGEFSEDSLTVEVTAEGFAGPFAYQVLSAESGDALDGWLTSEGFELGDTAETVDSYIAEGGYSFVAVTLTPDSAVTPAGGRQLPALAIQSDSTELHFPARMALTSMAEQQRTIIYVVGDNSAEVSSGWQMDENHDISAYDDADPIQAFNDALLAAASAEPPAYNRSYSGPVEQGWMTRFDTLAPRIVHTVDPTFAFIEDQYYITTEISVSETDTAAASGAWLLLPLLGVGWARRRQK